MRHEGAGSTLTLPKGGDTTLVELREMVAEAVGVRGEQEVAALRLLRGYPPVAIQTDSDARIESVGITNYDSLMVVEGDGMQQPESDAGASGKKKVTKGKASSVSNKKRASQTPAPSSSPSFASLSSGPVKRRKKKAVFPGKGARLGSGTDDGGAGGGGVTSDIARAQEMFASGTDAILGEANAVGRDLIGSVRAGSDGAVRQLYDAMKNAVHDRLRESEGIAKMAAAETGNVTYTEVCFDYTRSLIKISHSRVLDITYFEPRRGQRM